jgi:hypothetical protein
VPFSFSFLPPVHEKLTRANYSMWHAQVSSTLMGAQYTDHIDPSVKPPAAFLPVAADAADKTPVPNPEHAKWVTKDHQVRSYLFSSLSKEVFSQVSSATTAAELWAAIQANHASQSHARVMSTRMALATASKGASSLADYYTKMKGLADDMAAVGCKIDDEELVSFILAGLGDEYESVIAAVAARVEPITVPKLYAQLISHEQRKQLNGGGSRTSANMASKGGCGGGGHYNACGRRGGGRGFGRGGPKGRSRQRWRA